MTSLAGVRVLAVDDNEELLFALVELLRAADCEVLSARNGEEALKIIHKEAPDVVLLDVVMPQKSGLDVLSEIKNNPKIYSGPVLLVTSKDEPGDIRKGLELGAVDYVSKPYRKEELLLRIQMAFDEVKKGSADYTRFHALGMIGDSHVMRELFDSIAEVADSGMPVLIFGETGSGKDLVARAIHSLGSRAGQSFLAVNCSNFSPTLLTSELFGHVRGAFTGADTNKAGLFETAHRGILFLDEVAELSAEVQSRLLRVLQDGSYLPVGSATEKKADVRIVAATHGDVAEMVSKGSFREDLWFRLRGAQIRVPPLRERREDIPNLVKHFIQSALKKSGDNTSVLPELSSEAESLLCSYSWPGNVRELQAEVLRILMRAKGRPLLTPAHISEEISQSSSKAGVGLEKSESESLFLQGVSLSEAIGSLEKGYIEAALTRHSGNKTQAAKELGISRSNLIAKVKQYAIESTDD